MRGPGRCGGCEDRPPPRQDTIPLAGASPPQQHWRRGRGGGEKGGRMSLSTWEPLSFPVLRTRSLERLMSPMLAARRLKAWAPEAGFQRFAPGCRLPTWG